MNRSGLALFLVLLPTIGLSAPPQRCDDVPRAVMPPFTSPRRHSVIPHTPPSSAQDLTRRQRIQNLKERVNELKTKFEKPPAQTPVIEMPPQVTDEGDAAEIPIAPSTDQSRDSTGQASTTGEVPSDIDNADPAPDPQIDETPQSREPQESPPESPNSTKSVQVPAPDPLSDIQVLKDPAKSGETVSPRETESTVESTPQEHPLLVPAPEPTPAVEAEIPPIHSPSVPRSLPDIHPPESPIPRPSTPGAATDQKASPLTLPTELLDQAIDRQRMGNNLYAIGAYELALLNYETMLKQPLSPSETQWVNYQVANCQRHLGQMAEAQKSYRRVTGETSEEWLGQMARWWLKQLDEREQMQRRISELDQVIKTGEQELNRAQ